MQDTRASGADDTTPIVEMQEVGVRFGNVQAIHRISLSIRRGEIVALLGDNGAGKSTIANTLTGLCDFQQGCISFSGKNYQTPSPTITKEHGIVSIQQDIPYADNLTVVKYFFLGRELLVSRFIPLLATGRMRRRVQEFFDSLDFDFKKRPSDLISILTKEERQILDIARAYYFYSSLIIMDESTNSLSKNEYVRVMKLLEKVREQGGSILFIDHKAQDIYDYADRFLVLYGGKNLVKIEKNEASAKAIEKILISSHLSTVKEMAAGITHQIRNPLAIMKISAQMVKEDFRVAENGEEFRSKVDRILRDIDMIDLFVNNFFNFTHEHDIYYKKYKVRTIIDEAVEKIPKHVIGMRTIEKEFADYSAEYSMVKSNVVQVLINLLLKIIESTDPDGYIRISASIRNQLHIEFSYRGGSIPRNIESGNYSPLFFREKNSASLGATLFHHMYQQQHCTIEVGTKAFSHPPEKYIRLAL